MPAFMPRSGRTGPFARCRSASRFPSGIWRPFRLVAGSIDIPSSPTTCRAGTRDPRACTARRARFGGRDRGSRIRRETCRQDA